MGKFEQKYKPEDFMSVVDNGFKTAGFIAGRVGCSRSTAVTYLNRLYDEGKLNRFDVDEGQIFIYTKRGINMETMGIGDVELSNGELEEYYDDERDGYACVLCNLDSGLDVLNSINEHVTAVDMDDIYKCINGVYLCTRDMIVLKALSKEVVSQQLVELYERSRFLRSDVTDRTRPSEVIAEEIHDFEVTLSRFIDSEKQRVSC